MKGVRKLNSLEEEYWHFLLAMDKNEINKTSRRAPSNKPSSKRSSNASVVAPPKALPERRGQVFHLDQPSTLFGISEYSLIAGLVQEITATDLVVAEGTYPTRPSVLVIGSHLRDYQHEMRAYDSNYRIQHELFGPKGMRSPARWFTQALLRENDFLSSLVLGSPNGDFFLEVPANLSAGTVRQLMGFARRYFDMVFLVDSTLADTVAPQVKKYVVQDMTTDPNMPRVRSRASRIKKWDKSKGTLVIASDDSRWLMNQKGTLRVAQVPAPGNNTYSTFARVLLRDVIRHMVGVPLQADSQLEELGRGKLCVSTRGARVGASTILFPASGWVAFSEYAELGGDAILLGLALGTIVAGGGAFVASAVAGFNEVFRTFRDVKKAEKNLELPGFTYKPLKTIESATQVDALTEAAVPSDRVEFNPEGINSPSDVFLMPIEMIKKRHETVMDAWIAYETNPLKFLEFPLMSDMSCEQTLAFHRAMRQTQQWAEVAAEDPGYNGEYAKSVSDLEEAFSVAEANAKKMRLSHLDDAQRKNVNDAKQLVRIVQDEHAAPTERLGAWKRASTLLEGIVALPENTVVGLLEATPAAQ